MSNLRKYTIRMNESGRVVAPILRLSHPTFADTMLVGNFDLAPDFHWDIVRSLLSYQEAMGWSIYVNGMRHDETNTSTSLRDIRDLHGDDYADLLDGWSSREAALSKAVVPLVAADATTEQVHGQLGLRGLASLRMIRGLASVTRVAAEKNPEIVLKTIGQIMQQRGTDAQRSAADAWLTRPLAYATTRFRTEIVTERRLRDPGTPVVILWDDDELDYLVELLGQEGWSVTEQSTLPFCRVDSGGVAQSVFDPGV